MSHRKLNLQKELEHLVKICSSSDTPSEYCFLNDESQVQCKYRGESERYPSIDMYMQYSVKERHKCKRYN